MGVARKRRAWDEWWQGQQTLEQEGIQSDVVIGGGEGEVCADNQMRYNHCCNKYYDSSTVAFLFIFECALLNDQHLIF